MGDAVGRTTFVYARTLAATTVDTTFTGILCSYFATIDDRGWSGVLATSSETWNAHHVFQPQNSIRLLYSCMI